MQAEASHKDHHDNVTQIISDSTDQESQPVWHVYIHLETSVVCFSPNVKQRVQLF